jgi:hypothetical protein
VNTVALRNASIVYEAEKRKPIRKSSFTLLKIH